MSTPPNKYKPPAPEQPDKWKELLYTPERVQAAFNGTMTFRELHMLSSEDMRSIATTGVQLFEQGRYSEAKVVFEGLNALDPTESYYVTALGAIYLAQKNLPLAIQALTEAIKLNKADSAALIYRGQAYLRQGDYVAGANDLKRLVELDPKHENPLTLQAVALARAAFEHLEELESGASAKAKPALGKSTPAKAKSAKSASKKRK